MGLLLGFMMTASGVSAQDVTAPVIQSLGFTPTSIDTTTGSATVTVTVRITDDVSGVSSGGVNFRSPSGAQSRGAGFGAHNRISGDARDGVYRTTMTFPQYGEGGQWYAYSAYTYDLVGNQRSYSPEAALIAAGFPTKLDVTSTPDVAAPVMQSLGFTPTSIDTTTGSATVTVTVRITDDVSGVSSGGVNFRSPSGAQSRGAGFGAHNRISGDARDGVYRTTMTFPQYGEGGQWYAYSAYTYDLVGNQRSYSPEAALIAADFPTKLDVTSTPDVAAPVMQSLGFTPTSIDTTTGSATVTVTVRITDDVSGVSSGGVNFRSPSGAQSRGAGFGAHNRISGDARDGVYRTTMTFPQYGEGGQWYAYSAYTYDLVGNQRSYSPEAALIAAGFPTKLDVIGNEPPVLANPGDKLVNELETLSFTLSATDPNPLDTLTFSIASGAQAGMTLDASSGAFAWTPAEAQGPGSYAVTFRVTDPGGMTSNQTITIAVNEVNTPPVASSAGLTTPEDTALAITLAGSDADLPANPLTFSIATPPIHGTLSGTPPNVTYTPVVNYHGPDNFTFTVSDGSASHGATIYITVTPVEDPLAEGGIEAWGWGNDQYGQLGNLAGTTAIPNPVVVPPPWNGRAIVELAAGYNHSLAVLDDGMVWTWGYNGDGQLGLGVAGGPVGTPQRVPPPAAWSDRRVTKVAGGSAHSLALLDDGSVWAWGSGTLGQLGNGTSGVFPSPVRVVTPTAWNARRIVDIGAGWGHSLALLDDGSVWSWGSNQYGQLGLGGVGGNGFTPQRVVSPPAWTGRKVAQVAAGPYHNGVVLDDGTVWTWGSNLGMQLGIGVGGGVYPTPQPVTIGGGVMQVRPVIRLAAGHDHNLALRDDGRVFVWGLNGSGQLGTGSVGGFMLTPAPLSTPIGWAGRTVVGVAAGAAHSLAVLDDGTVWAWGQGSSGQLGNNSGAIAPAPVAVLEPAAWNVRSVWKIAAGANHSLVILQESDVAPIAAADAYTVGEDGALEIPAPGLLGNDSDANGDTLEVTAHTDPAHGDLELQADGSFSYLPAEDFHGADSFTYTVSDTGGLTATATVSITVTPVNDAPVADAASVTTAEDTAVDIALTGSDVDGDALIFTVVSDPLYGTVSGNAPNLTYTAAADFNGSDSFAFMINDGTATSAPATVSISVTPVNDAPVASGQSVTIAEDATVAVTLAGSDVDGDALTYTVEISPAQGTLSGTAPNLTYTPALNYHGPDSFTFKANDGAADSAPATVSITVTPVNDPPVIADQTISLDENSPYGITIGFVQASDPDAGDTLTYRITGASVPGVFGILTSTGELSIVDNAPLDFETTPVFTLSVEAKDAAGLAATATVTVRLTDVDEAPVAIAQSLTTDEDVALELNLGGTDPEGAPLTYTISVPPSRGILTGAAPSLTYTPHPHMSGSDGFSFTVSDGTHTVAGSVAVEVRSVNDAPQVVSTSVLTAEDTAVEARFAGTDVEATEYTLLHAFGGGAGLGELGSGGLIRGSDGMLYGTTEQGGTGGLGTVFRINADGTGFQTLHHFAASGAQGGWPVARLVEGPGGLMYGTTKFRGSAGGGTVWKIGMSGTGFGVLKHLGSSSAEGRGAFGGLLLASDGWLYGTTVFGGSAADAGTVYKVRTDGTGFTTLHVFNGQAHGGGRPYARLVEGPDSLLYGTTQIGGQTQYGGGTVFRIGRDGSGFQFLREFDSGPVDGGNPNAGLTLGVDGKLYGVTANGGSGMGGTVFALDRDGSSFRFLHHFPGTGQQGRGPQTALVQGPDGILYGVNQFNGLAGGGTVFRIAADGTGLSVLHHFRSGANDLFQPQGEVAVGEDGWIHGVGFVGTARQKGGLFRLRAEPVGLAFQVVSGPARGTRTGEGAEGVYTPAANYHGPDSIVFRVDDGELTSPDATLSITVTSVNDVPVAEAQSVTTAEDAAVAILLAGSDVEGSTLGFSIVSGPAHGTLSGTAPNLTYTPAPNYHGPDSFSFKVNDGTADSAPATVSITVTPVNDPPVAGPDSYSTGEDSELVVTNPGLLGNDSDPDEGPLPVIRFAGRMTANTADFSNGDEFEGSYTIDPAVPVQITFGDGGVYRATLSDTRLVWEIRFPGRGYRFAGHGYMNQVGNDTASGDYHYILLGNVQTLGTSFPSGATPSSFNLELRDPLWAGADLVHDTSAQPNTLDRASALIAYLAVGYPGTTANFASTLTSIRGPREVVEVNGQPAAVNNVISLSSGATLRVNRDGTFRYDPRSRAAFVVPGVSDTETFTYTMADPEGAISTATVTLTLLPGDRDADGVANHADNCPLTANADQSDLDRDGAGDVCDPDIDGDGFANADDPEPADASVYPGALDVFDGKDNDGDGIVDGGVTGGDLRGMAFAWGWNLFGQLGDGTTVSRPVPGSVQPLPGGRQVTVLAAGEGHNFVISEDQSLWAWGPNGSGRLGDGTTLDRPTPVEVVIPGDRAPVAIAAGNQHTLALAEDGTVWSWGLNTVGQLGDGTTTSRSTPGAVNLPPGVRIVAISSRYSHSMAIDEDGGLWAWGYNQYGQLGDGTTTTASSPVAVQALPGGRRVVQVCTGVQHSLALADDGTVWAWGLGSAGELGTGATGSSAVPVPVIPLPDGRRVVQIDSGLNHNLALASDGSVWAWGYGADGQLGQGNGFNSLQPVQVPIPEGAKPVQVAGASHTSFALLADGTAFGWGSNDRGVVGDGSQTTRRSPVSLVQAPHIRFIRISGGGHHALALAREIPVPPTAVADAYDVKDADGPYSLEVLDNDTDANGDALTVVAVTPPIHGTASVAPDGSTVIYQPQAGYVGVDSFEYTVSDGNGGTASATVTLTATLSDRPPVAVAGDDITVRAGTDCEAVVGLDGGGSSDPDGDVLAYRWDLTQDGVTLDSAAGPVVAWVLPHGTYVAVLTVSYEKNGATVSATDTVVITVEPSAPVLASLSPSGAHANGPGFQLVVHGGCFLPGAVVHWNGQPRSTTVVGSSELAALIPASDLQTGVDIAVAAIQVVNGDGQVSNPLGFSIVAQTVGTADAAISEPGGTSTVSTAPTTAGEPGVTVSVQNDGSEPVTVLAATYDERPVGDTAFQVDNGAFVDVQVTGPTEGVSATVYFYYPSTVTGGMENRVKLRYFNGTDWIAVLSSGGLPPAKDTTDNLDGTISGGRFAVVFDATSTPTIGELTGTVFGMFPSEPQLGNITGPVGPVELGNLVGISVGFAVVGDPAGASVRFVWDDGTESTVAPDSATSASATHLYGAPGVHGVTVQVTDAQGDVQEGRFEYVVIFDPDGGFVTGGGWIESAPGAYLYDPTLSGRATFGFNSRYHRGQSVPSGQTQFQFQSGDFRFHSTAYEWLVVAGSKAQYKGVGVVNGVGEYGFLLTATDGAGKTGVDAFRIKVWDRASGVVVYDNRRGGSDDMDAADPQAIGGGSIVIQRAK